jgi:hypothetical protein
MSRARTETFGHSGLRVLDFGPGTVVPSSTTTTTALSSIVTLRKITTRSPLVSLTMYMMGRIGAGAVPGKTTRYAAWQR